MQHLPYRRLAGFYLFYFAYIGAFTPFFGLYLLSVGRTAVEIGVLMALPAVARIVAPHLWGWLRRCHARPGLQQGFAMGQGFISARARQARDALGMIR